MSELLKTKPALRRMKKGEKFICAGNEKIPTIFDQDNETMVRLDGFDRDGEEYEAELMTLKQFEALYVNSQWIPAPANAVREIEEARKDAERKRAEIEKAEQARIEQSRKAVEERLRAKSAPAAAEPTASQ